QVKGGFWGLGCDLLPGLHHPEMHFDRAALADGVRVFKSCIRQLLG
ncbi:TPA: amidohydrolase, partial [Klebsiella oxytoca]|nr:amidohydrolase [Klebsiella michiganensis]HBV5297574.1 amidohydrolase [Klebsiella oxytoca]